MNATDTEERIKAGFAELLAQLQGEALPNPGARAKANAAALEREQARVRAEYLHHGLEAPSPWALSLTAIKELNEIHGARHPAREAAE